MKVPVKKSIQSLHTFGRHLYGGSIAALPLFITSSLHTLLFITLGICLSFNYAAAQQQDTNRQTTTDEMRMDALFNQIMDALPQGARVKVDSAASMKTQRRDPDAKHTSISGERKNQAHKSRINDLPEELKVQVERTIVNMEIRKEEKRAQFRETLREKQ